MRPLQQWIALALGITLMAACQPEKGHQHPASHPGTPHWSYEGADAPQHWAKLCSEFRQCAEGHQQSPIDIETVVTKQRLGHHLDFQYHTCPVDVVNNGHTIQVNPEEKNILVVDGRDYELKQFHFHEPAEHRVDGVLYPMELHLVHADTSGHLAVVGIFIKEGLENPVLTEIWKAMPRNPEAHQHPNKLIDLTKMFPSDHTYYHYSGSLTTPPCTEGVEWYVMASPIAMSKSQIEDFRRLYHGNVRPLQAIHERALEASQN